MNINNQRISFNGKPEVIHALKHAAFYSNDAAIGRLAVNSKNISPAELLKFEKNTVYVDAYTDMACFDKTFIKTIQEMTDFNLKILKLLLCPKVHDTVGNFNPIQIFREYLVKGYEKNHNYKNRENIEIINKFIEKIQNVK